MELNVSDLVVSTAGRDRGELFYVIGTEGVYALIANGRDRTLERPKRKKRKHLLRVEQNESEIVRKLKSGDQVLNAQLRKALAIERQTFRSQNQGG